MQNIIYFLYIHSLFYSYPIYFVCFRTFALLELTPLFLMCVQDCDKNAFQIVSHFFFFSLNGNCFVFYIFPNEVFFVASFLFYELIDPLFSALSNVLILFDRLVSIS